MTATTQAPAARSNGDRKSVGANPLPVRSRQRNIPLGILGALLILSTALGGLLWSRTTTTRTEVLVAAHDIPAGRRLDDGDLRVARLAIDGAAATIPASQRSSIVGQIAVIPIPASAILAPSEIGQDTSLSDDEAVVGVVLAPGASPTADLRSGDRVAVIEADKTNGGAGGPTVLTTATVYAVDALSDGSLTVSLRVPADAATKVVGAAAGDRIRLVLLAPGAVLPASGS